MLFEEIYPVKEVDIKIVDDVKIFPHARGGHRIVAHGQNLYLLGGYNPTAPLECTESEKKMYGPLLKELWSFNVPTKKWTKLETKGRMPNQLVSHSVVVHDESLYVFGGTSFPFGERCSNDLHVLDLSTLTWSRVQSTGKHPRKQYGHAAVMDENNLYIIGGTTGCMDNMDVFHLNLDDPELEWKKLNKNTCQPRYRHEVVFYNNYLLVFGGGGGKDDKVCSLSTLDIFNIATGTWETISTLPDVRYGFPAARRCHGLVQSGIFVYITGGTNGSSMFDDIWRYDIANNSWTRLNAFMPQRVFFHSTTITQEGWLYSFGGVINEEETQRTNQLYGLSLSVPPTVSGLDEKTE